MTREDLVPPFRFALLAASPYPPTSSSSSTSTSTSTSALYRGSLPLPHHVPFLSSLNLKTIISLTPKPLTIYEEERIASPLKRRKIDIEKGEVEEELVSIWCKRRGINIIHIKSDKSKDGSIPFNPTTVKKVLELMITEENLPIYIHDLDGSDVLGIIGASLRKLMNWNETSYTDELSRFLRIPPAEPAHLTFIRKLFNPSPSSMISNSSSIVATSTQSHPNLPTSHINNNGGGGNLLNGTNGTIEDPTTFISIPNSKKRAKWFYSNGIPNSTNGNTSATNSSNATSSISSTSGTTTKSMFLVLGGMKVKLEPEEISLPSSTSTVIPPILATSLLTTSPSTFTSEQFPLTHSNKSNHSRNLSTVSNSTTSSIAPIVEMIDKRSWSGGPGATSSSSVMNSFTEGGVLNGLMRRESLEAEGKNLLVGEKVEGEGREKIREEQAFSRCQEEQDTVEDNEEEEEEEDDDEEEEEEEVIPLSQMIDALDLGL